ncbi:DUF2849 domain-containing protein [Kordiimonas sp. SCSIO 12610]|uniref:DUF2849 domain-containing protein n=1 Tax=Kordiimonas sp. SCSIO 12610 TaxID=2829597 RepID=UPI00210D7243|nr:DUF2849 domain-containing protein [Kordiimonas sp. SCSIO 12610]UTW55953.1 DUF2849 domain-containing protein [Kordiimonas sp. SCSIO 12610]
MAKKIKGPQLIIANRLDDGRVVFMTPDGNWTADVARAAVADTPEGVEELEAKASISEKNNLVVDPQAVPAEDQNGAFPAHMKQAMQAKGPSVRPDLGYQVSHTWETNASEGN